jgi:hypothetical protein
MHHSMHNGSMALAASALPMSAVSQPNWSRIPVTPLLASAWLPQMNVVGLPADRVPIIAWCPGLRKPLASALPTSPEARTPTFIAQRVANKV